MAVAGFYAASGLAAGTLIINKAAGATVSTPTLNTRTHTCITINAVSAPSTSQSVEYVINTSNVTPSVGWQTIVTFNGLNPNTPYYIFARSASNTNYNAGEVNNSLAVTTLQSISFDKIEYYWENQHNNLVTTSGGVATISSGLPLTITAQDRGYVGRQWFMDGLDTWRNENT